MNSKIKKLPAYIYLSYIFLPIKHVGEIVWVKRDVDFNAGGQNTIYVHSYKQDEHAKTITLYV